MGVETPREKQLLEIIERQAAQLKKCDEIISRLEAENTLLRQRVDLLVRKVFGPSSEKIDPSQLDMFLQGGENSLGKTLASSALEEADPLPRRRRAPRTGERLPEDLPVVEQVIDPEEVKAAPDQWRCIGSEVSEQLDYEPARFLRRRLVRRKYVSKIDQDAAPVIAELPAMLQQRSTVAPGLLAQIIVSKYCYHLPLYRQEQIYWTRHRVWLPRQNLAHWMEVAADWLKPIYQHIRTGVMAGAMSRLMKHPWTSSHREMAKPRPATFGPPRVPVEMSFTSGKPAGRQRVWTTCCRSILRARSSAMGTRATPASPAARSISNLQPAGLTRAGRSTKRGHKTRAERHGCYARSFTFIKSKESFAITAVAHDFEPPSALIRPDRFISGSIAP